MRLPQSASATLLASLVPDGRDEAERPASDGALLGSWSATRWQYVSRADPEQVVDVVCDLGGSVTLSLSDGTYVLTWAVAGQGSQSIGGALTVQGSTVVFLAHGASEAESVVFRLAGDTLALSCETSGWEFEDSGTEQPASFVGVLVRL